MVPKMSQKRETMVARWLNMELHLQLHAWERGYPEYIRFGNMWFVFLNHKIETLGLPRDPQDSQETSQEVFEEPFGFRSYQKKVQIAIQVLPRLYPSLAKTIDGDRDEVYC